MAGRDCNLAPEALCEALRSLMVARQGLPDWVHHWRDLSLRADQGGLGPLGERLASSPNLDAGRALDAACADRWLPLAIDAQRELRGFRRWEHPDRIARFQALDAAHHETLSVITSNIQQKQLIFSHLDGMRTEDLRLEWFFEDAQD